MKKNGTRVYGITDQLTQSMVVFNLESAVFELKKDGKGEMHINDMIYQIDPQELVTLLQGSGVELMHCTKQAPDEQAPLEQPLESVKEIVDAE